MHNDIAVYIVVSKNLANMMSSVTVGLKMQYDVIVIGAGSAGSAAASRLSEDPDRSILLLEAGPDYPDIAHLPDELKYGYSTGTDIMVSDEHNWQFKGKGNEHTPEMLVPRGKVTGGTSAINGQIFLRGLTHDFDDWANNGNDEWTYEKVLPFFRNLETDMDFSDDFHGKDGPIICRRFKREDWLPSQEAFFQSCRNAGFPEVEDFNQPDSAGVGAFPNNNPNGIRFSSAIGYLTPARYRLNLTIRSKCFVRKLLFKNKKFYGVEVESAGDIFTVEGKEAILSSGTIANAQILLLSGIGPTQELEELGIETIHNLPGVGKNFSDHPLIFITCGVKDGVELDGLAPRLQVGLRYTAEGSTREHDMMIWMTSFATERVNRGGERMEPIGIRITCSVYLADSKGEIKLLSSDPRDHPFLDFHLLEDPEDLRRMRESVRKAVDIFNDPAFSDMVSGRIEPLDHDLKNDDSLNRWLQREVTTGQHLTGTCKMGPKTDPMAVVDQNLKIHGLEGIRVADASIMPDTVRANTNVTTMMIGERVANFISTDSA